MASLALSLGSGSAPSGQRLRSWHRAASTFISRATRFRDGNTAGRLLHRGLQRDPRDARGRWRAESQVVTVHEGIDVEHVLSRPSTFTRRSFFRIMRRSSGTWARSSRTRVIGT
jgi:hypothetical protein